MALDRSPVVALTPRSRRLGAGSSHDWLRVTGKTQLAAYHAESQWHDHAIDLLIWIDASSTAAILSGYVAAARALTGTRTPGTAEAVSASLLGWLSETDHRWLVVLDDVPDSAVLQGLWPGRAGGADITECTGDGGPGGRADNGDRPAQPPGGDELPGRQAVLRSRSAPRGN
jgi:hypothetical protein